MKKKNLSLMCAAMLAATADFTFFIDKKSVLSINSPFVLSAKAGKNVSKEEIGSADALTKTNLVSFVANSLTEVRLNIFKILNVLPDYNSLVVENGIDLNKPFTKLNKDVSSKNLIHTIILNYSENEIMLGNVKLTLNK